jgi:hypothetical protein
MSSYMIKAINHLEMLASDWQEYPIGDDGEDREQMASDLLDALTVIKASLLYEELNKPKYSGEGVTAEQLLAATGIKPNK